MKALIDRYGLIPHPEGGYFREVFRSDLCLSSPAAGGDRRAATHIYFMLTRGQVSRFHRVVHDELWHFYRGAPLRLFRYDGSGFTSATIGPDRDYMAVVPGNVWQAAESTGEYSLVGCTVAPGFEFADFAFLRDDPEALRELDAAHPGYRRFI